MIIKNKEKLKRIIDSAKKSGKPVLIKKGVFDIIHLGHIYSIKRFTQTADITIILVQSDKLTKVRKGSSRPINNQKSRLEVVDSIKGVDYVYPDKSNSREEYINFLNYLGPTIVAITKIDSKKTKAYSGLYWKLKEFPDKELLGYSTTSMINKN
jgi:cytidyltransferase-like protein